VISLGWTGYLDRYSPTHWAAEASFDSWLEVIAAAVALKELYAVDAVVDIPEALWNDEDASGWWVAGFRTIRRRTTPARQLNPR
jgi:hypothetical protein